MSALASFTDFTLNILEELVPGFIILLDKVSLYISIDRYNLLYYFFWVVRFVTFTYIFVRMTYLLFIKNEKTYVEYVPIRLLISVINMVLAIFILTKFKDTLKLISTRSSPEIIGQLETIVQNVGKFSPDQVVNKIAEQLGIKKND